ncbi:MAG: hypothetical protein JNL28_16060 [Planctomycetes bacterium]|nr:hypothetical protein [Planctomycetota bacterium]
MQLFALTDLHDPRMERGVLGKHELVDVLYSEERGPFLSNSMPAWAREFTESTQLEFAARWKRSAQSFVFEIVPD